MSAPTLTAETLTAGLTEALGYVANGMPMADRVRLASRISDLRLAAQRSGVLGFHDSATGHLRCAENDLRDPLSPLASARSALRVAIEDLTVRTAR